MHVSLMAGSEKSLRAAELESQVQVLLKDEHCAKDLLHLFYLLSFGIEWEDFRYLAVLLTSQNGSQPQRKDVSMFMLYGQTRKNETEEDVRYRISALAQRCSTESYVLIVISHQFVYVLLMLGYIVCVTL